MNDVVVEHTREITYNQNNHVKNIVDKFKAVHNGAKIANAFGFVIKTPKANSLNTITGSSAMIEEEPKSQFIVFENFNTSIGQEFVFTRTFGEIVDKLNFDPALTLFIVSSYIQGEKNRKEVHLPNT